LRLFKAQDGALISSFEVCPKGVSVTDLNFSQKSSFIIFGCDDGTFGIFNTRSKTVDVSTSAATPAYPVKSVGFSKEQDQFVLTGSSDGQIVVRQFIAAGQGEGNTTC
jgi:WD40 repeat protein